MTWRLLRKNRNKFLKIGYLSSVQNTEIGLYNTIYENVGISNSLLGDFVYIAPNTLISNTKTGKFCSIGPNVRIGLGIHPTHFISTFPAFFSSKGQCQIVFTEEDQIEEIGKVEIGNDVWIGANALIMYNVKIGDGAVIAAGAIVTKDVEPYSIVAGVPAREIKKRFTDEEISALSEIKWWDKDISWLKNNARLFTTPKDLFYLFSKGDQ